MVGAMDEIVLEHRVLPLTGEALRGVRRVEAAACVDPVAGDPAGALEGDAWLARHGSDVVGFLLGSMDGAKTYRCRRGGVLPDWGRRRIARRLLAARERFLEDRGVRWLHAERTNRSRSALALHLSDGFEVFGLRAGDQGEPWLLLRKDLMHGSAPEVPVAPAAEVEVTYGLVGLPLAEADLAGIDAVHTAAFGKEPIGIYRWLEGRPGASCWVACAEGAIVGFKFGAEKEPGGYHSHEGAVLPAFRRRGIARALMAHQHEWARASGYRRITTNTFSRFRGMVLLNLSSGFDIVGATCTPGGRQPKLHMAANLWGASPFGPEASEAL